jgi:hypothetical protein
MMQPQRRGKTVFDANGYDSVDAGPLASDGRRFQFVPVRS